MEVDGGGVADNEKEAIPAKRKCVGWRGWLLRIVGIGAGVAVGLVVVAFCAIYFFGEAIMTRLMREAAFQEMLAREVSKAIKVDGKFDPISMDGWTAVTGEFVGTGWPGEAIAEISGKNIRATFDPAGIAKSQWLVSKIELDSGKFVLRLPDDALKRKPAAARPRPWYANLMPREFHCNWIECAVADVEFPFGGKTSALRGVHVGATMIKQDFKYFIKGGVVDFALLPEMDVEELVVYVTREMVEVDSGKLAGRDDDPARVELSGRIGQREDKSISAKANFVDLPFAQLLPEDFQSSVAGRVTGSLDWNTDKTGKDTTANGHVKLIGASLKDWGVLDELARISKNPEVKSFVLEDAEFSFGVLNGVFSVTDLSLVVRDKISLNGSLGYDSNEKVGALDVTLEDMPVSAWLPAELKASADAHMRGKLKWNVPLPDWKSSQASGHLDFSGARLESPVGMIDALGPHLVRLPEKWFLKTAKFDFDYAGETISAENLMLEMPEVFKISGSGSWGLDETLGADVGFHFAKLESWLPATLEKKVQGALSGHVQWSCPRLDFKKGKGKGRLNLAEAVLSNFEFQYILSRFLKDESFLVMDFQRASVGWQYDGVNIRVESADFLAEGHVGLRGKVLIADNGELSGELLVGASEHALSWLPEATTAVFMHEADGLFWADVVLSGTLDHPENDLTKQVWTVLKRHPLTLAGLAAQGLSWWLGDFLNTAPKRPE